LTGSQPIAIAIRFGVAGSILGAGLGQFLATYVSCLEPQSQSTRISGRKVRPYLVNEYSTRSGISSSDDAVALHLAQMLGQHLSHNSRNGPLQIEKATNAALTEMPKN
jgi:hypothetical protein